MTRCVVITYPGLGNISSVLFSSAWESKVFRDFFSIHNLIPSVICESQEAPIIILSNIPRREVITRCLKKSGAFIGLRKDLWNLFWGSRWKTITKYHQLKCFQRVNHFPGTIILSRKDYVINYILEMKRGKGVFRKRFDFIPRSFFWPKEEKKIRQSIALGEIFIAKPPISSQGKGIIVFDKILPIELERCSKFISSSTSEDNINFHHDTNEVDHEEYLIQYYLSNPLLVNGFKVDFRVYVVCTSFDPLLIYVYSEGLVRFCSEPYPSPENITQSLGNARIHLTNTSINKQAETYNERFKDGSGSKWSFESLKSYFEAHSLDWSKAWRNIEDVIVKTFFSVQSKVVKEMEGLPYRFSCFELYGFDIFLDNRLKAFLIEINAQPALTTDTTLDRDIKGNLIADTLNLVGIPVLSEYSHDIGDNVSFHSIYDRPFTNCSQHNIPNGPSKYRLQVLNKFPNYIPLHLTQDEKKCLLFVEVQLLRSKNFIRVFPRSNSLRRFSYCSSVFSFYNRLLCLWESLKKNWKSEEYRSALLWLNGIGSFPYSIDYSANKLISPTKMSPKFFFPLNSQGCDDG